MAKSKTFIGQHTALTVALIIVLSFAAGFLLARAKYKPQIKQTFDMVMERENTISELQSKIQDFESQLSETSEN
jgi:hypothetical protein